VLKAAGLNLNEPIDVREESGVIMIEPLRRREYSVKDLVDQIKPANLHEEIDWGARAGKEVWSCREGPHSISFSVFFYYDLLMFCPKCKAEYRAGFTECSDCGERLVERLDASVAANRARSTGGPELLWSGTDAGMSELIIGELDQAGIPHHSQMRDVGLLPGLSQPVTAIFIPAIHHDAAHAALQAARRESESDTQMGAQTPGETASSSEAGSAGTSDEMLDANDETDRADLAEDNDAENYDADQATAEVWFGDDADTKDMLIASLRENGIESEVAGNGEFRIRVMPSAESRAREIIHEVIDATPPQ